MSPVSRSGVSPLSGASPRSAAALLKVLFGYFVQPYIERMQSQDAAAEAVHVDVSVDTADGTTKPPKSVVVAVTP
jgi:hypothetical protein